MTGLPWMNSREVDDWLLKYRLGEVENEFGDFECSIQDCKCIFSSKLDTLIHLKNGRHGRIGDRFSDEERIRYKYSSRQGRLKHDVYRSQQSQQSKIQKD